MNRVAAQPFPALLGQTGVDDASNARGSLGLYGVMAICLLHIPVAIFEYKVRGSSTVHALVVFALGMLFAVTKRPVRVVYVCAYITGAEVLWRMTGAQVFWEFGKYSTAVIVLLAIVRRGSLKGSPLMFAYFALLLPSIMVVVSKLGKEAQEFISFNLSGPFSLMMMAWFFSELKLSVAQIQRVFLIAVGPLVGIGSIAFFSVYTAEKIVFTANSNLITSAGFGPNQVSAALGLGALFALLFIVVGNTSRGLKIFMLCAMFFLATQSALTFSRGGLYNFIGAAILSSIYLARDPQTLVRLFVVAAIAFVLVTLVIFPQLDSFTGGHLGTRFSSTNTTSRTDIAWQDLRLWRRNPLLGVGPGGSASADVDTAHTEFVRLLAEHGTLGFVALVLLIVAAVKNVRKAKSNKAKAVTVCVIAWSFLFMLNAAMRTVSPAFMFGLAFATILPETTINRQTLILALKILKARRSQKKTVALGLP
jgi:O-antigen ligase